MVVPPGYDLPGRARGGRGRPCCTDWSLPAGRDALPLEGVGVKYLKRLFLLRMIHKKISNITAKRNGTTNQSNNQSINREVILLVG